MNLGMHFHMFSLLCSVWRFCFVTSLLAGCLTSDVVLSAMITERKISRNPLGEGETPDEDGVQRGTQESFIQH